MEKLKDKCALCGKEVVIVDKDILDKLKTCKGKCKNTKIYCSDECRRKDTPKSVEGSLDVSNIFS